MSKLLCQKCFSLERPLSARGKIYFATIMNANKHSADQSQNEDNFPTFSLGLEFLNEAEKEKNNGKGDSTSARRHDSLHWPRVKCIKFWQKDTGKNKQMTNWSVSAFKGKLNFFRFKIVNYKTGAFDRKFEIKPIPISLTSKNDFWYCCPFFASDLLHNSTGYVIKQLVHAWIIKTEVCVICVISFSKIRKFVFQLQ